MAAPLLFAAGPARVVYTKSFPGSQPPFEFVSVDRTGGVEYREAETDDAPVKTELAEPTTSSIFDLAEKLDYFRSPLDSGLKVANTGKKILRYCNESGTTTQSIFNYSTNPLAQQLVERMEQIADSERALLELDRTTHFDKLGVNDALASIESLWLRKELAAPNQFLPLLNRIATHDAYMHLVRERAARLKEEFEAASAPDSKAGGHTNPQ
jgi:hypothetical protein